MTRDDWRCPRCGSIMSISSSGKFMLCYFGAAHSKLHPRFGLQDLPEAMRINNRDSWIRGFPHDVYQYVPHGHRIALDKAPAEGHVVASVAFRGHRAVRLFKRKRTLRERLREHYFQKLGEGAGK